MHPISSVHLWCRDQDQGYCRDNNVGISEIWTDRVAVAVENNLAIMKEGEQVSDAMERLERKINKEIAKPFVDIHFLL